MSILGSEPAEIVALKEEAKIDYIAKKHKIKDLILRLNKILDVGIRHFQIKEYRKSFILLSRFINTVEYIQKQKEYKNNPASFNLPNNQAMKMAQTTLATVHKTLVAQFSANKLPEKESLTSNRKSNVINNDTDDVLLNLPETPTDEPINDEPGGFIKCTDFYKIVSKPGRYLIIDVRPLEDFRRSKVKSDRAICIPEDIIKHGTAAHQYESMIKTRDYKHSFLYKNRGKKTTDQIFLLDWSTNHSNFHEGSKIAIMKEILTDWNTEECAPIFILDGGFTELLNVFPMFVTDPKVTQNLEYSDLDEVLNSVTWDFFDQVEAKNNVKKPPTERKTTVAKVPPKPEKFRSTKRPEITNDDDEFMNLSGEVEKIYLKPEKIIPPVYRNEKPPVLVDPAYRVKLKDSLSFINELTKEQEKFEKQICDLEETILNILTTDNRHPHDDDVESLKDRIHAVKLTLDNTIKEKSAAKSRLEELEKSETPLTKIDDASIAQLRLAIDSSEIHIHSIGQQRKTLNQKRVEEERKVELQNGRRYLGNQTYKEPLKNEGSTSGLKRSLSSPNLAKSEVRKVPFFDRSTKPVPTYENQNESNNSYRRSPWKDPSRNMDPVFRNGHPGITGLKNLGNSCYMNSIIQCLSNTAYLARYFIDSSYQDDLNTGPDNETRGQIAEEFAQVIKALWRGQYKSIAPRDLKDTIGHYRFQYQSTEQQDSHEFLTFLLEWMHNDLKKDIKLRLENQMGPAEKAWDKALKGQSSVISKLFIGQLRSTIQCLICDKKSITYETFSSLSISLPDANRCLLDDCIKRYLSAQKIQGWTCPNCKTARDASKKFDFVKLPTVLVIHLNRFAGTDIKLEKKNTSVSFPIDELNLQHHLVEDADTIRNRNSYVYNLYGLSNHSGSMDSGHYTAFCKNSTLNKWYQYNDQTVTEISQNDVKTQNTSAYLLFYTSYVPYIDDN